MTMAIRDIFKTLTANSPEQGYRAAKESVVFLDRGDMGHLIVSGADHADLLHRMTTNELRNLTPGQAQFNVFTNEKGRIIDRVHLLKLDNAMRLITSAGSNQRVAQWIEKFVFIEDVKIEDRSGDIGMLTFIGPQTEFFLDKVLDVKTGGLPAHTFLALDDGSIIVKSALNSLPVFDVVLPNVVRDDFARKVNAGEDGQRPFFVGGDIYKILCIEAGWPLYPADFNEELNPHEVNMLGFVNFDKGCYIGQEVVARLDTYEKVQRKMIGVRLQEELRYEQTPVMAEGKEIGTVTSAAFSPGIGQPIALATVKTKFARVGEAIIVDDRGRQVKGWLSALPFDSS
jgi:folate-binding protein YgfZ